MHINLAITEKFQSFFKIWFLGCFRFNRLKDPDCSTEQKEWMVGRLVGDVAVGCCLVSVLPEGDDAARCQILEGDFLHELWPPLGRHSSFLYHCALLQLHNDDAHITGRHGGCTSSLNTIEKHSRECVLWSPRCTLACRWWSARPSGRFQHLVQLSWPPAPPPQSSLRKTKRKTTSAELPNACQNILLVFGHITWSSYGL